MMFTVDQLKAALVRAAEREPDHVGPARWGHPAADEGCIVATAAYDLTHDERPVCPCDHCVETGVTVSREAADLMRRAITLNDCGWTWGAVVKALGLTGEPGMAFPQALHPFPKHMPTMMLKKIPSPMAFAFIDAELQKAATPPQAPQEAIGELVGV